MFRPTAGGTMLKWIWRRFTTRWLPLQSKVCLGRREMTMPIGVCGVIHGLWIGLAGNKVWQEDTDPGCRANAEVQCECSYPSPLFRARRSLQDGPAPSDIIGPHTSPPHMVSFQILI